MSQFLHLVESIGLNTAASWNEHHLCWSTRSNLDDQNLVLHLSKRLPATGYLTSCEKSKSVSKAPISSEKLKKNGNLLARGWWRCGIVLGFCQAYSKWVPKARRRRREEWLMSAHNPLHCQGHCLLLEGGQRIANRSCFKGLGSLQLFHPLGWCGYPIASGLLASCSSMYQLSLELKMWKTSLGLQGLRVTQMSGGSEKCQQKGLGSWGVYGSSHSHEKGNAGPSSRKRGGASLYKEHKHFKEVQTYLHFSILAIDIYWDLGGQTTGYGQP
jgi:hypothetical protein